eukprot:Hpha_TRINITY_DN15506_c7_g1::TRINITY_DN15506_c7_g1_i1::g.105717::m.105717
MAFAGAGLQLRRLFGGGTRDPPPEARARASSGKQRRPPKGPPASTDPQAVGGRPAAPLSIPRSEVTPAVLISRGVRPAVPPRDIPALERQGSHESAPAGSSAAATEPAVPALSASVLSSSWAIGFVVVRFDLELGAVLESVVPEGVLTPVQQREMTQLGFPDSNSHVTRDCCYVIKADSGRSKSERTFNYGYVYFRQKKDKSVKRGFLQHSLILLSRWPFTSVLEPVVKSVAQRYFAKCPFSPSSEAVASTSVTGLGSSPISYETRKASLASGASTPIDSPPSASPVTPAAVAELEAQETAHPACFFVAGGLAVVAAAVGEQPRLLDGRCKVLQDALLDISHWALPESCSEYSFRLFGEEVPWRAPYFTVTASENALGYATGEEEPQEERRTNGILASPRPHAEEEERLKRSSMAKAGGISGASAAGRLLGRLTGSSRHILSEVSVYPPYRAQLRKLWQLWELQILGEPLCILSTSPTVSSAAVLSAVALIQPITYVGDFRPYFAVQHADFATFRKFGTDPQHPFPATGGPIIGCTNPYFAKALASWPHFAALLDHSIPGGMEAKRQRDMDLNRRMGRVPAGGRKRSERENLLWEFKETFQSRRVFVVNDTDAAVSPVLAQLLPCADGIADESTIASEQVNSEVIKAAFHELTDSFLEPLRRCFDHLWKELRRPLILPQTSRTVFTADAFREDLRNHGYVKRIFKKGRTEVLKFYDAFLDGPHFPTWLQEQMHERARSTLVDMDMLTLRNHSEEQRIDLLFKLQGDLREHSSRLVKDRAHIQLLEERAEDVVQSLPEHLRAPVLRRVAKTFGAATPSPPPTRQSSGMSPVAEPELPRKSPGAAPMPPLPSGRLPFVGGAVSTRPAAGEGGGGGERQSSSVTESELARKGPATATTPPVPLPAVDSPAPRPPTAAAPELGAALGPSSPVPLPLENGSLQPSPERTRGAGSEGGNGALQLLVDDFPSGQNLRLLSPKAKSDGGDAGEEREESPKRESPPGDLGNETGSLELLVHEFATSQNLCLLSPQRCRGGDPEEVRECGGERSSTAGDREDETGRPSSPPAQEHKGLKLLELAFPSGQSLRLLSKA